MYRGIMSQAILALRFSVLLPFSSRILISALARLHGAFKECRTGRCLSKGHGIFELRSFFWTFRNSGMLLYGFEKARVISGE
jgi:hypothetical protein